MNNRVGRWAAWLGWSFVSVLACGQREVGDADDELMPSDDPFDPERVLHVSITMTEEDWNELRRQSRHGLDLLGDSCNVSPPVSPYTYFPADMTIDGVEVERIGVRKKGFFGSVSEEKPSLKLKFDEYVDGQRHAGLKRMTLNNNLSDPSQIKQCLGYDLLARAGVPAPRCSFATVEVNGVKRGIYTHVEPIKKDFLARHFADTSGNLYEGALTSDFRPGWVDTLERKTNESDLDRRDIEALTSALQVDDDALLEALDPLVDIGAFINFWAMEVILMHADGYARSTNNFYLYRDPEAGKFAFIPWGIDMILYPDRPREWEESTPPGVAWAEGMLARRLYLHPETQSMYLERLQQLLDDVWDEATILSEIDRMERLLLPEGEDFPEGERELIAQSVDEVRDFVATRREHLESILAEPPAAWDRPLRDPFCLEPVGSVHAEFSAPWSSLDDLESLEEGAGSIDLQIHDDDLAALSATVSAGTAPVSDEPVLIFSLRTEDERTLTIRTVLDETALRRPLPIELSLQPGQGAIYQDDGSNELGMLIAEFGSGTLQLRGAEVDAGANVRIAGSLSASLYTLATE